MATRRTTSPNTRKTAATTRKPRAAKAPTRDFMASVTAPVEALVNRTGNTIRQRPYTAAAVATGAIATLAGLVAGALFYKRNEKLVNDKAAMLGARVKDGLGETSAKARDLASRGSAWIEQKTGRTLGAQVSNEAEAVDDSMTRGVQAIGDSAESDMSSVKSAL